MRSKKEEWTVHFLTSIPSDVEPENPPSSKERKQNRSKKKNQSEPEGKKEAESDKDTHTGSEGRERTDEDVGPITKKSRWKGVEFDLSIPTHTPPSEGRIPLPETEPKQDAEYFNRKKELALRNKKYRQVGVTGDSDTPRTDRLRRALQGLSSGEYKTIHAAAVANGINYDQVRRRVAGSVKWYARNGPQPYLSLAEERYLAAWVEMRSDQGDPVRPKQVRDKAQEIVLNDGRKTPFRGGRPSNGWYTGFLKRNPTIRKKLKR